MRWYIQQRRRPLFSEPEPGHDGRGNRCGGCYYDDRRNVNDVYDNVPDSNLGSK